MLLKKLGRKAILLRFRKVHMSWQRGRNVAKSHRRRQLIVWEHEVSDAISDISYSIYFGLGVVSVQIDDFHCDDEE